MAADKILTHDIETTCEPVLIRKIAHQNHYDYSKLHRHNYFEVMFFQTGGGVNRIDLHEYDVRDQSCYIIYPSQTHLLRRNPGSAGMLIQFKLESLHSVELARMLQEKAWSRSGAVVFEENQAALDNLLELVRTMQQISAGKGAFWKQSQQSILQALLYQLCAFGMTDEQPVLQNDIYEFQRLVDGNFKEHHSVSYYLLKLTIGEKKLATLTKQYLGATPLQVIHNRLLLEAKRLLLLGDKAHKEIALDLGFDSPASFSAFIKKKTGQTASEIQQSYSEIQNV